MKKIAIFASGTGSNARKIHEFALNTNAFEVACIMSNRKNARVLDYATDNDIPNFSFTKEQFLHSNDILNLLKENEIQLIVLAGFLWLFPEYLIKVYPNQIVNIHPALLPKYGGKGMYGLNVHKAVKEAKESESGITIHFVNENYDKGRFIFQTKVKIKKDDSPVEIGQKVLKLEHHFFPKVVAGLVKNL